MPSEAEELRLVVNLTDNASAGLSRLRYEVQELGGGRNREAMERFKRDTEEITKRTRGLKSELAEFGIVGNLVAGAVGGIAAGFAMLAGKLALSIIGFGDAAKAMRELNQEARQMGVDPVALENIIKQYEEVGVAREKTLQNMRGLSQAIGELFRPGSQGVRDLMNMAGSGLQSRAAMQESINALKSATTEEEKTNIAIKMVQNTRTNAFRQYKSEQEAALRANELAKKLGVDLSILERDNVEKLTAADERRARQRQADLIQYNTVSNQIWKNWEQIRDIVGAPILKTFSSTLTDINNTMRVILEAFKWIDDHVGDWGDMGKITTKLRQVMPTWLGGTTPEEDKAIAEERAKRGGARVAPPGAGTTSPAQRGPANDNMPSPSSVPGGGRYSPQGGRADGLPNGQTAGPGTGPGAGATPPMGEAAAAGASLAAVRATQADELADPAVRKKLMAYAHAEVGSQGPQAVQAFIETTLNRASARGKSIADTLSGSYFPGATHTKAAAGAPQSVQAEYDKTIDQVLGGSNISGYATGNASGPVGFGKGGYQTYGGKETGGERFGVEAQDRAWADRMRTGTGNAAAPGGTKSASLDPSGGIPESKSIPSQFQTDLKALVRNGAGPQNIRAYMMQRGINLSEATCGKFMASVVREHGGTPPKNPETASNWNLFGGKEGAGYSADPNAINIAVKQGARIGDTGSHVTGVVPIVEDGKIVGYRGIGVNQGKQGVEGVGPYGRDVATSIPLKLGTGRGQYQIRHQIVEDRQQLDAAQAAATKVEGTGKITVDVNAPKGTNVGAEGGGLFKKTEINRQTQMEPAARGPEPAMAEAI